MYWTIPMVIALVAAPLALLAAGDRLAKGSLRMFAIVAVVTWAITTVAMTRLLFGVDDVGMVIIILLLVMPAIGSIIAAVLASRLLRGSLLPALVFALQGWGIGLVVLLLGGPSHTHDGPLWDWNWAYFNALPAAWAACGAIAASSLRWRNAP